MTPWDIRALLRALGAASLGLVVVWLVTAASDEGQLTIGARAGRTLPIAPLCSAVGAALALGTARVKQEALAFEALGRSPAQTGRAAAIGAAIPSLLVAIIIGLVPSIDVGAFFPRAASGDTFVHTAEGFASPSLGVTVDADGEPHALAAAIEPEDSALPRGARLSAAIATGLAGLALSLVAARASLRQSLLDRQARRRMRVIAFGEGLACTVAMLVLFQSAAAKVAPAALVALPPVALLALAALRLHGLQPGARS